jgi:hypothetical protein
MTQSKRERGVMKKLFALGLLMAMPASATVLVTSATPVGVTTGSTQWANAPLTVGGYAYIKSQGKCCTIVRINDMVVSADSYHQQIWITTFYSDSSGNWPVENLYWRTAELRFNSSDLQGIAIG